MSFFSVVVPMLYGPGIERLIESLERQTIGRAQYEVIIVGMERKERAYTSDLVHFDRTSHPLSPASARNRGAAQAVGDVIAFTDADCVARPNWLAVLADRFADPPVTVVGGGVEFDTHSYWAFADNLSMFHAYMAHLPPGERRQLPSLNLAIRRDVFMQLGGFDENYPRPSGEDADLTLRLRRGGHPLLFEPRAIVKHEHLRNRLIDLLRHGYYQGKYSTKVDPRYASEGGLPRLFRTRVGLITFAPILAAGATTRIFATGRGLWRYWATMPAIYMAKLAWCIGASTHP